MGISSLRLAGLLFIMSSLICIQPVIAQDNIPIPIEGDCLIRLLGEHINNENVQELIEYMGVQPPFHHLRGKEIVSTAKGIRIAFDADFRLIEIVVFNNNYTRENRSFSKFSGQLPFKLTFKESYNDLVTKLGKPAKVKTWTDSTSYTFKNDLLVSALCDNSGDNTGEFYYISFSLKKKDTAFPFPARLNCDSLANKKAAGL